MTHSACMIYWCLLETVCFPHEICVSIIQQNTYHWECQEKYRQLEHKYRYDTLGWPAWFIDVCWRQCVFPTRLCQYYTTDCSLLGLSGKILTTRTSVQIWETLIAYRADSRFAPSQWETALLCSDVSYWLSESLESALCLYSSLMAGGDIGTTCVNFIQQEYINRYDNPTRAYIVQWYRVHYQYIPFHMIEPCTFDFTQLGLV